MIRTYDRKPSQPIRRAVGVTAAAGLVIAALVAGGGGGETMKYDDDTEAALKRTINPTMVSLAGKAVRCATENPGQSHLRREIDNSVTLVLDGTVFDPASGDTDISVATMEMDTFPGSNKPNPNSVRAVLLDWGTVGNEGKDSAATSVALLAPGAKTASVAGNDHPEGWSAQAVNSPLDNPSVGLYPGSTFDSSNPALFTDKNYGSTGPVTTARQLAQAASILYEDICTALATHQNHQQ